MLACCPAPPMPMGMLPIGMPPRDAEYGVENALMAVGLGAGAGAAAGAGACCPQGFMACACWGI